MPVWRLQTAWAADTTFATDQLIITPHFNDSGALTDPQNLCDDLNAALQAWDTTARQLKVTAYDAQGTPPVYPVAESVSNLGLAPVTGGVREVAICLSYFSQFNRPRYRGRLYIPISVAGLGTTASRPSLSARQKVADLVPIFADLGGSDVDWCVFSRAANTPRSVSNWWVDDAWDIQRSRGLTPTTRLEGSVGE